MDFVNGVLANSWQMYVLCGSVVAVVLLQAVFFLVRAYREGVKIGMEKSVLNKTITSSLIFSILPSVSILVGVFALAGSLGIQLPWLRLSVVGALHYEITAANVAIQATVGGSLGSATITPQVFATISFIMTIAILGGIVTVLLFYHKIDKGVKKVTTKNPKIGNVVFAGMFIGLICSYISTGFSRLMFGEIKDGNVVSAATPIPLIAMAVSFVVALILYFVEKKFNQKWLKNFSVSFSMLIGMVTAMLCSMYVPMWRF